MIEHLAAWIDRMPHSGDLVLETRGARDDAVEDREQARRLPHGVAGELHGIEEVSDAPERQWIEQLSGHAEHVQRVLEPAAGPQRKERVALEIRRGLRRRVERRRNGLRI